MKTETDNFHIQNQPNNFRRDPRLGHYGTHTGRILKGLSSSRSGGIFFGHDYNEGLKFGDFRFSMYRYKCFGPNKTYFMNFCQKLSILELIYEKKQICYFHVGYAIKLY